MIGSCSITDTSDKTLARVARYMAGSRWYGWGGINNQKKVKGRNIWWFSCEEHGGYVVVVPHDCKDKELYIPDTYTPTATWANNYLKAYQFEEDCDWALLEYWNPSVKQWSRNSFHSRITEKEHDYYVLSSIARYTPEYVKFEDKKKAYEILTNDIWMAQQRWMGNDGHSSWYTSDCKFHMSTIENLRKERDRLCANSF